MNFTITFLPIILLILIIMLFYFLKSKPTRNKNKLLRGKSLKIFFTIYIAALIAGCVLFTFIPFEEYEISETIPEDQLQPDPLYNTLGQINIDEIKNMKTGDRYTFEYREDTLDLSANTNEYLGAIIIIEKKNTNDNVIKVSNYFNPVIVDQMIISEYPTVGAVISGNSLILQSPQHINISICKLQNEFTISQFTGVVSEFDMGSSFSSENVLLIQIPKDLKVISSKENIDIHYVNE